MAEIAEMALPARSWAPSERRMVSRMGTAWQDLLLADEGEGNRSQHR
eukprot:gene43358-44955_t